MIKTGASRGSYKQSCVCHRGRVQVQIKFGEMKGIDNFLENPALKLNLNPLVKAQHDRQNQTTAIEDKPFFSFIRMEHLVAGVSGGVASTLILHPLDLVKIRFAVSDGLSSRPQYSGLSHAFKSIFKDEGVRGLYRFRNAL